MTPTSGRPRLLALTSTGQVSGAERVLLRTLAAAVAEGWEVTCACPAGPLVEQVTGTGARHLPIPELTLAAGPKPVAALRTLLAWLRAALLVRRAASSADVVLVNALLALPALRLSHTSAPALWLAHDVVVAPGRLRLYRWCRGALVGVVGVSEVVIDRLRIPERRRRGREPWLDVVHNGVEHPVAPAAPSGDVPIVGINALLTPWKGQEVLLEAAALLDVPARIEVMGGHLPKDADYAARLRERVSATELRDRVTMVGHTDDPLGRMRTWTVAVSASTDPEACPLNVLEAMSIGVPVVATDHGGAPEVLDGAGLLVPPRDATALADALTRFLVDPDLRARCAEQGLDRITTAHRLDGQTARLLDVLRDAAQEEEAS